MATSTGKTLTLSGDQGIIYPTNVSSLNFISRADGLSVNGGGLQLLSTANSEGLCGVFTRATGYDRDNVSMVSSRQFTNKQYVDSLASNYLSSTTTLT